MKNFLFFLFIGATVQVFGQVNFPKDTLDLVLHEGSDIVNEQPLTIVNNKPSGVLDYNYHILVDEFKGNSNWTVLFCDCERCIENYPDTGACKGLKPKESWFFNLDVTTSKAIKDKYFTIAFSNPNDSTDTDTITFRTVIGNLLSIGTENKSGLEVGITPNPAEDQVSITFNTVVGRDYSFSIVNILGEAVLQEELNGGNGVYRNDLDISDYESGLYFVHLKNGAESQVEKLIIR